MTEIDRSSFHPSFLEFGAESVEPGGPSTGGSEAAELTPPAEASRMATTDGPRPDLAATQLEARLHAATGSGPSWLSFMDSTRGLNRLVDRVLADGHVSPAEVKALVKEAKDFGSITDAERQVLVDLLRDHGDKFAPVARVALSNFLGVEVPADALAGRNAPGPAFGSPEFEALLDAETSSVARADNRVDLLFDGAESYAERFRLIDQAEHSINFQAFIFKSDETGWELAKRLAARAEEGLEVRVIYDGYGSFSADSAMFDYMRERGVEVREYSNPMREPWNLNNRWHEKHLIVDGKVSIEGGMNVGDEYAFGGTDRRVEGRGSGDAEPWRDVDIRVEGPAVHDAQSAFLRNWSTLGGEVTDAQRARLFPEPTVFDGGPSARVVQHLPGADDDKHTNNLMLNAIRSAEESITIETAYFVPPPGLQEALREAALRGVDVQVMTNSATSSDMGFVAEAGRHFYDDLVAAGVRIYEKQVEGATLHSKTMTLDGKYSIVGSVNMNSRSKTHDSEVAVAVQDPAVAEQLERRFAQGLERAKEVTAAELEAQSFMTNLRQWGLSLFSGIF